MKKFKLPYLFIIFIICALLKGGVFAGAGSSFQRQAALQEAASQEAALEQVALEQVALRQEKVKLIGRTKLENGTLWLTQSASGIEFTTDASFVRFEAVGNDEYLRVNPVRFAIWVNGERIADRLLSKESMVVEVPTARGKSVSSVRILKLSEAFGGFMGIRNLQISSGSYAKPTQQKKLRIEFIGDSITCGYGVDDENPEHGFSTATEDATKTYAYKTAQALDADYSMVCYSSCGIASGYTSDGSRAEDYLVPDFYEQYVHVDGSEGYFTPDTLWDFSRFTPDIVVINLGTNDFSYTGDDEERRGQFRYQYYQFLLTVRAHYPEAQIICSLGMMGDALYRDVEDVVSWFAWDPGDEKISAFHFSVQDGSLGFAAGYHPTEGTHAKAARELTAFIRQTFHE